MFLSFFHSRSFLRNLGREDGIEGLQRGPMSTYAFITQSTKMLKNLGRWLDKAAQHAQSKKVEPDTLVDARLVFDQYALVKQVQSACDSAKFAAAYLSGKEAPAHPDTERTMTELHDRIKKAVAYLETFKAQDFAGAEERKVAPKWLGGKWLRGEDYVNEVSTPNFYFHVVTAYAILRSNGVDVGKQDFIGSMSV
ncbi:MAG TPA: DUF1993 domain-containing protein, partial [Candidatus Acidoferrum sp.]|nr:DUF1993 domain-containing protein [Candidatus Acidoferrum sp.]